MVGTEKFDERVAPIGVTMGGRIWTDVQIVDDPEVTDVIKVLLIDLDGILRIWDPDLTATVETAYDLPPGALAAVAFAPHVLEPALTGKVDDRGFRDSVARDLTAAHGDRVRGAVDDWMLPAGRVDTDVLEVLRRARHQARIILLTNATSRLAADLETLGLTDEIDGSVTSAQLGMAKPDPDVFSATALDHGLMLSEIAYVDTSPVNVATAEILGIRSHQYAGVDGLSTFLDKVLTP